MKRVHLRIRGRVQGVFYRASTRKKALELGLVGWVRNRADGSVEAVAEGAPTALEQLAAWCRQGPPSARVDQVDVDFSEPTGDLSDFEIRG